MNLLFHILFNSGLGVGGHVLGEIIVVLAQHLHNVGQGIRDHLAGFAAIIVGHSLAFPIHCNGNLPGTVGDTRQHRQIADGKALFVLGQYNGQIPCTGSVLAGGIYRALYLGLLSILSLEHAEGDRGVIRPFILAVNGPGLLDLNLRGFGFHGNGVGLVIVPVVIGSLNLVFRIVGNAFVGSAGLHRGITLVGFFAAAVHSISVYLLVYTRCLQIADA